MKSITKLFFISVFLFFMKPAAFAEDLKHQYKKTNSGVGSLSPELRSLLTKEMVALQKAMLSILPAYIAGNWSEIESIALKMKNSYILKQSLSEQQIQELHHLLPDSFLKLDEEFHYYAGMLNHVASNKKVELIGFYISKINETCLSCHTQFANHQFPLLAPKKAENSHHH